MELWKSQKQKSILEIRLDFLTILERLRNAKITGANPGEELLAKCGSKSGYKMAKVARALRARVRGHDDGSGPGRGHTRHPTPGSGSG